MKKSNLWAAFALMVAMTTAGCSKDDETTSGVQQPDAETPSVTPTVPDEPQKPNLEDYQLTRSEQGMVNQGNDFAFNLFREVTAEYGLTSPRGCIPPADYDQKTATGNNILSPISIIYALGMLNNGAAGETQQQINKVLGFADTGTEGINTFCQKMLVKALYSDPDTKLNIANNIYFNSSLGYSLNPAFTQLAKEYYEAEPELRDFHDGKTMNVINQWCSDHTERMIEKVLDEDSFRPNAVSYLLNAIYFKGDWRSKFEETDTQEEAFTLSNNQQRQVPMMHQRSSFPYMEDDLCQCVKLAYGNGTYAMTVFLPREGVKIADVLETLTATSWMQLNARMDETTVDLKIPRFNVETDIDLIGIMSRLGMPKAFTELAEFPNFCDGNTFIGLMKQSAKIKVNESGTQAAAVTVIEITESAMPAEEVVSFCATRPFLYVINDQTTGAILFIGQYMGE